MFCTHCGGGEEFQGLGGRYGCRGRSHCEKEGPVGNFAQLEAVDNDQCLPAGTAGGAMMLMNEKQLTVTRKFYRQG